MVQNARQFPDTLKEVGIGRETGDVFVEDWRIALFLAQQRLGDDEVEDSFGIADEVGILGKILLDLDSLSAIPALGLVGAQSRDQLGVIVKR
jgi:hypothetical protein